MRSYFTSCMCGLSVSTMRRYNSNIIMYIFSNFDRNIEGQVNKLSLNRHAITIITYKSFPCHYAQLN